MHPVTSPVIAMDERGPATRTPQPVFGMPTGFRRSQSATVMIPPVLKYGGTVRSTYSK
jgi:hypothetical protein